MSQIAASLGREARDPPMSGIRGLLIDLVQYVPARVAPYFVGLVTLPVVVHLFSPAEYGDYVLVTTVVSLLVMGCTWLTNSIIRFLPRYEVSGRLSEFYNTVSALALVSMAALVLPSVGALILAGGHVSHALISLGRIGLALAAVSVCFEVLEAFLSAKRASGWYSFFAVWRSISGPLVGIALALFWRRSVGSLIVGQALCMAVVLPWMFGLAWTRRQLRGTLSVQLAKEMAQYGFPMVAGLLGYWVINASDRYILELFRGSHEVGIYSLSYAVSGGVVSSISSVFFLASSPAAMHLFERHGLDAGKPFLTQLTRLYLLTALPATFALGALGRPILKIFASASYLEGYRVMPLVAFSAFVGGVFHGFELPLAYAKRTEIFMVCTGFAALLTVGLNLLAVPRYGYMGAAAMTIVAYSAAYVPIPFISRRYLVWRFPFVDLLKVTCASSVMAGVMYYVGNTSYLPVLPAVAAAVFLGGLGYLAVLVALGGLHRDEAAEGFRTLFRRNRSGGTAAVQPGVYGVDRSV